MIVILALAHLFSSRPPVPWLRLLPLSERGVDVNEDDDEEVEERADDAQQGQDGLLPLLLGFLNADGRRAHPERCLSTESEKENVKERTRDEERGSV